MTIVSKCIAVVVLTWATCMGHPGWAEARTPEHIFNNTNRRSTCIDTAAAITCHRPLRGPHKSPGECEHVDRLTGKIAARINAIEVPCRRQTWNPDGGRGGSNCWSTCCRPEFKFHFTKGSSLMTTTTRGKSVTTKPAKPAKPSQPASSKSKPQADISHLPSAEMNVGMPRNANTQVVHVSGYGSRSSMLVLDVPRNGCLDMVVLRDEKGEYCTEKSRLDDGLADPYRYSSSKHRTTLLAKVINEYQSVFGDR